MRALVLFGCIALLAVPSGAWAKVGGGDIAFKPEGVAKVVFSHDTHVTKFGAKCGDCHYKIFTTIEGHRKASMGDMKKGQSCGACHNGSRAFTVAAFCEKCHQ